MSLRRAHCVRRPGTFWLFLQMGGERGGIAGGLLLRMVGTAFLAMIKVWHSNQDTERRKNKKQQERVLCVCFLWYGHLDLFDRASRSS